MKQMTDEQKAHRYAVMKMWREANPEKVRAAHKRYKERHAKEIRERNKRAWKAIVDDEEKHDSYLKYLHDWARPGTPYVPNLKLRVVASWRLGNPSPMYASIPTQEQISFARELFIERMPK